MSESSAPLSGPVEDYLKTIYELELRQGAASTSDVAAALDVAPPSVTGMIRRLVGQGLVDHERYRGVRLTEQRRLAALRTIRRHRIIETYLAQVLGFPWDMVHDEADRLEHAASDELIERLSEAMGHPRADPHGAPIPTADGRIDESSHRSLADLRDGESARMLRVSDRNPSLLRYLTEISLTPGVEVTMMERAPFDGPITLMVGNQAQMIGPGLAEQILVEPLCPR